MKNTPMKGLEQHLRTHYHEEFGNPSPASEFWNTLAGRLPVQEQPQSWWQRWFRALSPTGIMLTSGSHRVSTRRIALTFSLALVVLLFATGAFYATGAIRFHSDQPAQTMLNPGVNSAALLSSLVKSDVQARTLAFTTVNQTEGTGSNTINLQNVYADANNIVLGYTFTIKVGPLGPQMPLPTITLPGQQPIKPYNTLIKFGDTIKPGQERTIAALAYFNASAIQSNPQHIQLNISISRGTTVEHFSPTVPFSVGKTVHVHQTVTAYGHTIMLDRVVITPSESRFYFSSRDVNRLDITNLSISGKKISGSPMPIPVVGYSFGIWQNLVNNTGTWTVNVSAPTNSLWGKIWQFTFDVK
ncbi:DUF4179 domain-containing protein [Ktedonobacter robiniae]|uniref:DUF4179 domain-containing protein n=1 Tax=Ktedonobacter robiniae TaxID=2778365 RepID=A0ABQ3UU14_9CHLR|nr:DUF4179 domain-containing protein [Ktedonobacter robiniae]GHO55872.1 hypothetical protein KSB_43470 [Ktedonobacter robiniae]